MNTAFALRCSWRFSVDSTGIKSLLSNLSFTSTAPNAHRSVTESFLDESVLEGNRYVSVLLKKSLCLGTKTAWTVHDCLICAAWAILRMLQIWTPFWYNLNVTSAVWWAWLMPLFQVDTVTVSPITQSPASSHQTFFLIFASCWIHVPVLSLSLVPQLQN